MWHKIEELARQNPQVLLSSSHMKNFNALLVDPGLLQSRSVVNISYKSETPRLLPTVFIVPMLLLMTAFLAVCSGSLVILY